MREAVRHRNATAEFATAEGCLIRELSNSDADPQVLVFLAICTPRFEQAAYEDIDPAPPLRDQP